MILTVLRIISQKKKISHLGLIRCFHHDYIEVMYFGEEDHRGKVPLGSHYVKDTSNKCELLRLMLIFITCLRWYSSVSALESYFSALLPKYISLFSPAILHRVSVEYRLKCVVTKCLFFFFLNKTNCV